jgi:hypothetical protein
MFILLFSLISNITVNRNLLASYKTALSNLFIKRNVFVSTDRKYDNRFLVKDYFERVTTPYSRGRCDKRRNLRVLKIFEKQIIHINITKLITMTSTVFNVIFAVHDKWCLRCTCSLQVINTLATSTYQCDIIVLHCCDYYSM